MSDWCASRKVVSVMSRRFCLQRPLGEFLRAELEQQLARAGRRLLLAVAARAAARAASGVGGLVALGVRIAIDDDVAEELQQLRRAVAPRLELEELRRRIDHRRRRQALPELREVDDVFEERDVRLHAADAELAQRAIHAVERASRRSAPLAVIFTSSES